MDARCPRGCLVGVRCLAFVVGSTIMVWTSVAAARASFEPTDLELEDPGVLDVDLQVSSYRGDPRRVVALDWEIDLGILPNVELGVDGTLSGLGPDGGAARPLRTTLDPLWVSMKLGLLDLRDPKTGKAWAFGVQLGPRLPLERATGLGYEALVLVGRRLPPVGLVLQGGVIGDPRLPGAARAFGFEAGIDLTWALGETWAVIGELSAMRFVSADPHVLVATAGVARTTALLDIHVIAFAGVLGASDRAGVLIGLSPKIRLF